MKNMFKRNQVMITALAIMIAVAGYLNFAGTKVGEEELADVGASAGQESDMEALLELSDEDGKEDIASLDSDTEDVAAENFLNENMQTISDQDVAALTDDAADSAEEALDAEVQEGEIPGEAVYTNSGSVSSLSGARLLKEQTRAKNKETLLEIINNANIAENQKQEAVDEMIALTDLTERETAAEILLETRGYADAVVTITDESADVVVGMSVLSDAQCAQIEDIVAGAVYVCHQKFVLTSILERFGLKNFNECYQVIYPKKKAPDLPEPDEAVEIRELDETYAANVEAHYHLYHDEVYIRERIASRQMIGAFLDGELAGFAGVHNDGGMGMLEVLEPFRKRGIGSLLEAEMIRRELAAGHVPYAHVFVENEISVALQKKSGMRFAPGSVFWVS